MSAPHVVEDRHPSPGRLVVFLALLTTVSLGLGAFAAFPLALSAPEEAALKIAVKHVAAFEREKRAPSREEMEKLPRHMRPQSHERSRTGKRVDTVLSVELDGRRLVEKTYRPSGLRHDGPTFVYEEIAVAPGRHRLEAVLADAAPGGNGGRRWQMREEVEVRPRQVLLIEFSEDGGLRVRQPK